jgi:hypothetical protein
MQAIMAASATDHDCACDGESIDGSHGPHDSPKSDPQDYVSDDDFDNGATICVSPPPLSPH